MQESYGNLPKPVAHDQQHSAKGVNEHANQKESLCSWSTCTLLGGATSSHTLD
jgi:hypothetical protein